MDLRCKQIIKDGTTLENSIDSELLTKLTHMIPIQLLRRFRWRGIRELHIFGRTEATGLDTIMPGVYADDSEEWVLCVGVEDMGIPYYLSRCGSKLERLDIRFAGISEVSVRGLSNLDSLVVKYDPKLEQIYHLEELKRLRALDLGYTAVKECHLSQPMQKLELFWANNTDLGSVNFLRMLPQLKQVILDSTPIVGLPSLEQLTGLETLSLSDTKLKTLKGVAFPLGLKRLYLDGTPLHELPDSIGWLHQLEVLDLSGLELHKLPMWLPGLGLEFRQDPGEGIRLAGTKITGISMDIFNQPRAMIVQWFDDRSGKKRNRRLRMPWLPHTFGAANITSTVYKTYQELLDIEASIKIPDEFPMQAIIDWANEKDAYSFVTIETRKGARNTMRNIPDVWVGDDAPPEKSIWAGEWDPRDYYEPYDRYRLDFTKPIGWNEAEAEEIAQPLHEMKIVFLGDGEAGKSHTIARLLADGEQTNDFPGYSTPGIVIQDKTYTIGGREIKVHFWDFGGQEILHSMHRMFLTERTLYVVVLNVREGNQDERARYWLHNLRSFANGAPVLLVLNKMDMNKNASINESDLRAMYPGLTEVVKLSALTYTREEFENSFLAALKRQVGAFEYLESPFLPAWSRLKDKLQNMTTSYIRGAGFRSLCDTCGVKGSDDVRRGLLNWFSDLGVSFCYSGGSELEDYVVLRPDWITNAIYILLFNKITEIKNGLVTHDTIYRMLQSGDVERTVPGATYAEDEVAYVLNVIRKFRLSFRLEENTEFLPMLCDANAAPVAEEYAADPDALEFRMEYEYLPGNVLHRLMVERRRELDLGNVWLTGARFVYGTTGLSAVVKSEGELLRILVRSENADYEPQRYLDELKEDLLRINETMGLKISGMKAAYKSGGIVEYFDYDDLLLAQELGDRYVRSRLQRTRVALADILKQSDYPEDEKQKRLIRDIRLACEKLQDRKMYWNVTEDDRTDFIRDLLTTAGYTVLDQHRGGVGAGGERAGELDLDIRLTPDASWTVFEALNLKGSAKSYIEYWDAHLKKLLDNYNAIGRAFLFHVSYVECRKEKFAGICSDLREHMRLYSPAGFEVLPRSLREVPLAESFDAQNRFMRAMKCVYDCGGAPMTVYHFFVRMGGEKEKEEMA